MMINGIDLARDDALKTAGIDPSGPMSQYQDVLGATYVYCNQHGTIHRADTSCTVNAREKFPLATTGTFDEALAEARNSGFRIYGEPAPCQHCGLVIHQPQHTWVTLSDSESRCEKRVPTAHNSGHQPVANLPADRVASL